MNTESPLQQFRPALRFLMLFVAVYVAGNLLYGLYIESYRPAPDPATSWVTRQVALVLTIFDEPVAVVISKDGPTVLLNNQTRTVLRVYEGCNGLNVFIVFVSFLVAFGGKIKNMLIYIVIGCLILHVANLLRIILLYETAVHRPLFFYYFHKYFFTAVLYLIVFVLWIQWTRFKSAGHAIAKA